MAAFEVVALDTATPQLRAPGASDTYTFPRAAAFTQPTTATSVTFTPAANTAAVAVTGYSLTGSNAQSLLDLAGTWNTTGTPTAIKLNVTDTASNAASNLLDLQLNGTSVFNVSKKSLLSNVDWNTSNGFIVNVLSGPNPQASLRIFGGTRGAAFTDRGVMYFYAGSTTNPPQFSVTNEGVLGTSFGFGSNLATTAPDLFLTRDAADIIAQRRSTNAQTFRLYNTFTDASNYERGKIEWSSNVLRIGTEKAGTGTARDLAFQTDGTTRLTIGATSGDLTIADAENIVVGTTTGTKIGTATTQKLGFWNATPIVQPANSVAIDTLLVNAGLRASGGTANFATAVTAPNLATGRTFVRFTPLDNQPPDSNFATLDTRNSVAVLDFDAATDESAIFVGVIPQAATLTSGIKVIISWAATSATSGDCVWGVQFEKTTGQDIDSDSFDTATTGTTTTSGTSGVVNTTSITCTTIDSLAAGDCFRLKVYRDADAGGDTMTGDAELIAVEVQQVA